MPDWEKVSFLAFHVAKREKQGKRRSQPGRPSLKTTNKSTHPINTEAKAPDPTPRPPQLCLVEARIEIGPKSITDQLGQITVLIAGQAKDPISAITKPSNASHIPGPSIRQYEEVPNSDRTTRCLVLHTLSRVFNVPLWSLCRLVFAPRTWRPAIVLVVASNLDMPFCDPLSIDNLLRTAFITRTVLALRHKTIFIEESRSPQPFVITLQPMDIDRAGQLLNRAIIFVE